MQKLKSRFRQLTNALRYLARGDFSGLVRRLRWYQEEQGNVKLHRRLTAGNRRAWGIVCTPHTLFIAQAISDRLSTHGIESEVLTGNLQDFDHDFYIILCPQMFKKLPPPNKRVVFQLEQSVNSRWFTPEYMKILNDSLCVLEYSLTNIDFLAQKGVQYPKVYYLPIGAVRKMDYRDSSKKYDFVFYGDNLSSERRRLFLSELSKKYKVKVCNNVFGEEMYSILRQAKAVINIHYYENALLEMPRICECISLGVPVLSEGTADQKEYPELQGAVRFFDEGSIESMISTAAELLDDIEVMKPAVRSAVSLSAARFDFMMDRFLVALGAIPASIMLENPIYVPAPSDFFALSLPETIERRKFVARSLPKNCELFDGVRHRIGWVGCGSSFNALSRYAIAHDVERLTVMEDDAIIPNGFDEVLLEINQYLDSRKADWDVFSGLMADIDPEVRVLSVEMVGSRTYVTIDRMISMVFNIYNRSALKLLSSWNPLNDDAATNTIDRYLQKQDGLRVVVCVPFLVGYNEDVTSTLWGFNNNRYMPMIKKAERDLEALVSKWQREQSALQNQEHRE
ncbi:methyltransferase type 11 [Brucella gallinifaecis]|uniref:glycosyltransferase family protein n=1 Tax=Brucella gallinifaecis TaxID=215590 RepID=UPI002362E75A|nr:methyltransferase type 11 [Brucella gallinifaecis]